MLSTFKSRLEMLIVVVAMEVAEVVAAGVEEVAVVGATDTPQGQECSRPECPTSTTSRNFRLWAVTERLSSAGSS